MSKVNSWCSDDTCWNSTVLRYCSLSLLVWSALVYSSLYISLGNIESSKTMLATTQGREVFRLVEAMRVWNAEHNGIYVVQTSRDPPNPYLDESLRSSATITGKPLTLLNPAYMTRQISGVIEREAGIRLHLTSLKPINPDNTAYPWEAAALRKFEQGSTKEVIEFDQDGTAPQARYMAPLLVKQSCLACHQKQGYRLGDIRGGLSVQWSVSPMLAAVEVQRNHILLLHLSVWLLIAMLMVWVIRKLLGQLSTIQKSRQSLQALNVELEAKVEYRTLELKRSLDTLQTISDLAPGVVYQYLLRSDGTTCIPYASERFHEIFKVHPSELLEDAGKAFDRVHPDDVASIMSTTQASARELKPWKHEFRVRDEAGNERWIYGNTVPHRQEDGSILWNGFMTDITEQKNAHQALEFSEAQFRLLFESNVHGIVFQNERGEITEANSKAQEILGLTLDQMQGRKSIDPRWGSIHEDGSRFSGDAHPAMIALRTGKTVSNVVMGINNPIKGETCWLEISSVPQFAKAELTPFRVFSTFSDITERMRYLEVLKQHKVIVDTAQDGFWMTDAQGNIREVNLAYSEMTGYTIDELQRMKISDLEALEQGSDVQAHIDKIISEGHDRFETQHRHKDGHVIDIEISVTFMPEFQLFFVFSRDISQRKKMENIMRNLAYYDVLTGLPNRRMLSDRITQAMALSKRNGSYCALLFLDLDNFKPLNDTQGHEAGDALLSEVARRIKLCVREADTVARYGGDEFVVMLTELDEQVSVSHGQAKSIADKILETVAEPYRLSVKTAARELHVVEHLCTVSMGVALFVDHEFSENDLIKCADMAMYQAKQNGRNQIVFCERNPSGNR